MVRRTVLAWSFAAALLIGCGSTDTETGTAGSNDQGAQQRQPASTGDGENSATVGTSAAAEKPLAAAVADAWKTPEPVELPEVFAEDLKLTPPYAYLVAVLRPAKMLEEEGIADIPLADFGGTNPFTPSDVERAVATVYPRGSGLTEKYMAHSLGVGFALQLRKEVPRDQVIQWLSPRAQPIPGDDRKYFNPNWGDPGGNLALAFPDDRTILASIDVNFVFDRLHALDAKNDPPHALASAFAGLDADAHAVAAVDLDKLRHFVEAFGHEGEPLTKSFEPLQRADAAQLSVNLAKPDCLRLRVENDDAEALNEFALTARRTALDQVEATIAAFRTALGAEAAERIESVESRLQSLAESLTVHRGEGALTIQSGQLPAAAETLQLVAAFGRLQAATWRQRARDLDFYVRPKPVRLADDRFDQLMAQLDGGAETEVLDALAGLAQPQPRSPDERAQKLLDRVTPLLKSESPRVRFQALKAIASWSHGGRVDWEAVARVLTDPYEANRWIAIRILGEVPEPELVRAMLSLPWQDLSVAAPVLFQNYAEIAADAAVPLLVSPDSTVRAFACSLIGVTGNDSHVPRIEAMLEDENEMCRKAAKGALEQLQQQARWRPPSRSRRATSGRR